MKKKVKTLKEMKKKLQRKPITYWDYISAWLWAIPFSICYVWVCFGGFGKVKDWLEKHNFIEDENLEKEGDKE